MFLLVILACIALANAHGNYPHAQPYRFGYAIRDHNNQQYRQEVGNGVNIGSGSYGYFDGRGNIQYNNYGIRYRFPALGYGIGGYGLGYGGYGAYGLGNLGYGYGDVLGYNTLLGGYGYLNHGAVLV